MVTTREGKGAIDDRNPLSVGTMWVNRRLRPVLDAADVVLAVGTRLPGLRLRTEPAASCTSTSIPIEIGRNATVEVAPRGRRHAHGSRRCDEALAHAPGRRGRRAPTSAAMRAASRASTTARHRPRRPRSSTRSAPRIPDDAIVVSDTTTVGYMCHMYYRVYEPRTYMSTSYMGTLGFALPDRARRQGRRGPTARSSRSSATAGSCSRATELATAVQYGINTVTVVFDDGAYGNSNRDQRERFGGRELGTALRNPDWVKLADAFGAEGTVVDDIGKLPAAMDAAIEATTGASGTSTVIAVPMDRLPSPF